MVIRQWNKNKEQHTSNFNSLHNSITKAAVPPVPKYVGGFEEEKKDSSVSVGTLEFCHNFDVAAPCPNQKPVTTSNKQQVGGRLSDFVNLDGTLKAGFTVTNTVPLLNPQDLPNENFWTQQPQLEGPRDPILDQFQYMNAEDVFLPDGTVREGYETILDYAVFLMPDGTACKMSDLLTNQTIKLKSPSRKKKKGKSSTPLKYKLSSALSNSSVHIPFKPFIYQGVTIYPDKIYHVPIEGLPDLMKIPGFNLYPIEEDPSRIYAVINNTKVEITAVIGDSDPSQPEWEASPHQSTNILPAIQPSTLLEQFSHTTKGSTLQEQFSHTTNKMNGAPYQPSYPVNSNNSYHTQANNSLNTTQTSNLKNIEKPPIPQKGSPGTKVCAVMTSTTELGSSLANRVKKEKDKCERAQNTTPTVAEKEQVAKDGLGRPVWPRDDKNRPIDMLGKPVPVGSDGYPVSITGKPIAPDGSPIGVIPLVYDIQFITSTDAYFIGHPICSRGKLLRVGPFSSFHYPINAHGEAEGPNGKPLPRGPDGRIRYPTDKQGRPICPQGKLLPTGRDGYPVAPNGKPIEPCGRLVVQPGSTSPRFPIGPGGVHMWPVDAQGRCCDLNKQPLPLLEDGRPKWPVDMAGQPVTVDGQIMGTGPDGYPVDKQGRYISPGGTIVIKPKLPYPHQYQLGLPEYLKRLNIQEVRTNHSTVYMSHESMTSLHQSQDSTQVT